MGRLSLLLCVLPAFAWAAEPSFVLNHQGRLLKGDDTPVNGSVPMKFTLFLNHEKPAAEADAFTWTQEMNVDVRDGYYAVVLGRVGDEGSELKPEHLGDGQELRWLGVEVNGQALLPRHRIGAVPHAMRAAVATLAERAAVADVLDCVGCIDTDHLGTKAVVRGTIADGAVGATQLAQNAVGPAHLQDGAVSASKLSADECGAGQILVRGTEGWGCETLPEGALYQAGSGLALDGTMFSIPASGVGAAMIAANAVTGDKIASGTVTSEHLAAGAFPAITSVGTLDQLAVAGDVSVTGSNAKLSLSGADSRLSLGANASHARLDVRGAAAIPGTGTLSTTSRTTQEVNGAATAFTTQLRVGDVIIAGDQRRTVIKIDDAATLRVDKAFDPQLKGGTTFAFQRPVARIASNDNSAGVTVDANGQIGVGTNTPAAPLDVRNGPVRVGNSIYNLLAIGLPTTGSTDGKSFDPVHLKTDWICDTTANVMYQLEFRGHHFYADKPFHAVAVGYLYGTNGHTRHSVHNYIAGSATLSTYCASDDKRLVFKLSPGSQVWHASDLVVNFIGGGSGYQRLAADTLKFVAVEHRAADF